MEGITKRRAVALFVLFAVVLGLFGFTMYDLQVLDPGAVSSGSGTNITFTTVSAARGDILDRNGKVLVTNRASFDLVFNNFVLFNSDSPNGSLRELVRLLWQRNVAYIEHFPVTREKPYEYTLDDLTYAQQEHFRDFLLYRELDPDISAAQLMKQLRSAYRIPNDWEEWEVRLVIGLRYELELRNEVTNLPAYELVTDVSSQDLTAILELGTPGLYVETSTVREYATNYAAHVLGVMGQMDGPQYEYYSQYDYPMDAYVGQSGLEEAFELYLHGTDGVKVTEVDANGAIVSEYYSVEPKAGANVETTLDLDLQKAGEEALEEVILDLRKNGLDGSEGKDAEGGAVVAVDVKTGEVLVCASYPTFDPATYRQNYNQLLEEDFGPLNNRALEFAYAPGSVYKMAVTIAGFNSGVLTPNTSIEDEGVYSKYDDYQPECLIWTNRQTTHGLINVMQALQVSCNYYFYQVADWIDYEPIDAVAKSLGLGEPTGVELYENPGRRSNPESKKQVYADDPSSSGWYNADNLQLAIGQGLNRFTTMQLANYTAALANQGTRYKATFLSRVISSDFQELLADPQPEVISTCDISQEAYEAYRTGMWMAANQSGGTAYAYFWDYPIEVAAKTGTAQHGGSGSANGSFVCYAPYDDPQIAIAVFVEKGAQGGNLGNVAKAIMDVYFAQQEKANTDMPKENLGH